MIASPEFPMPLEVAAVFDTYPPDMRDKLLFLRQLILETAVIAS